MSSSQATWTLEQIVDLLEKVPIFEGLPRADLERIAGLLRGRSVGADEQLFREGDPGDRFYIVHSGAIEIVKERPRGDNERLAVKRAGEAFGEMSLLTDSPRSATARAVEASNLLFVTRDQFEELLGGDTLPLRLLRGLARALRALDVRFAARESGASAIDALREFNSAVHRGLTPKSDPSAPGHQVAGGTSQVKDAFTQSAWDFLPWSGGAHLYAVFDVKGHALPPAHLIALARALLREIARSETSFERLLGRLNTAVASSLYEGLDTCVQVRLIEVSAKGVRIAIAAEGPALLIRKSGSTELAPHGPPLGILPHFEYGAHDLVLESGDALLVASEAERGLLRGASEVVTLRAGDSASALVELLQTAMARTEQVRAGNDVTFVVVRRS